MMADLPTKEYTQNLSFNNNNQRVPPLGCVDPFDVEAYVMKEATSLPYYWPDFGSAMTQSVLQRDEVENGTYILRPTGSKDPINFKFLTLSIKMDFSHDATVPEEAKQLAKVWHFPIKVTLQDNQVFYSVTCTTQNVNSIDQLMEYHRSRPLKGGNLPGICYVTNGYQYDNRKPLKSQKHSQNAIVENYVQVDLAGNGTPPTTPTIKPRSSLNTPKISPRPSSPTPKPRITLNDAPPNIPPRRYPSHSPTPSISSPPSLVSLEPNTNSLGSLSRGEGSLTSIDRCMPTLEIRPVVMPPLPPPPRIKSPSLGRKNYSANCAEMCQCGMPVEITHLPRGWEVHRSLDEKTFYMLYFMDMRRRTAWAPSPAIDSLCPSREYLNYGRLNVRCFEQYALGRKFKSELRNYRAYEKVPRGLHTLARSPNR